MDESEHENRTLGSNGASLALNYKIFSSPLFLSLFGSMENCRRRDKLRRIRVGPIETMWTRAQAGGVAALAAE